MGMIDLDAEDFSAAADDEQKQIMRLFNYGRSATFNLKYLNFRASTSFRGGERALFFGL